MDEKILRIVADLAGEISDDDAYERVMFMLEDSRRAVNSLVEIAGEILEQGDLPNQVADDLGSALYQVKRYANG